MFDDSFKKLYKNVPIAVWSSYNNDAIATEIHNHAEIEISLKMQGESETNIDNKKYISKSGDICVKNPFEIHYSKPLTETSSGYCICFDSSLIADSSIVEELKSESIRITNHIPADDENIAEIQKLFMNIIECYERKSEYMQLEISAHISMFVAFLLNHGYVNRTHRESKDEAFCKNVFRYISQNYTKSITSKDVADALSYSHSYFCRKFRKSFGRKFYDYLNMYRVSEAQRLLASGEKTVIQVAMECGFNSQTYFAKCFRRYIGELPSEYRKKVNRDCETGQQGSLH